MKVSFSNFIFSKVILKLECNLDIVPGLLVLEYLVSLRQELTIRSKLGRHYIKICELRIS